MDTSTVHQERRGDAGGHGVERHGYGGTGRSTRAELAAMLAGGAAVDDVIHNVTVASVALVSGADCAKLSFLDEGRIRSSAATSELALSLDAAQQVSRHGPCLEAIRTRTVVRCADLRADGRWPQFAPLAADAGVRSLLSHPVDTLGDGRATLSLFGFRANAFTADSEAVGAVLANYASVALVSATRERHFQAALATRDVIGQAKGMIMERFGVDADHAFTMLTSLSQEMNTPVRDLAAQLAQSATRS
ncbi:GAF and ANTAR domain-containing protein [Mycobacterium yunnanensis]|uniref:GAF and ANTAR domain-containing protein n=1 Tax=Mycobacterium yunnanensis TaxID=368477 RepID=A0A9X3C2Q0_9MYCO|nr:GAF and ANTAR domain-containing protein [Mycobacterium yunnanensis]MCV7423098.1 GAF and ANTAR domain-containing protein [Mycobacterium yunnanensis]